MIGLATARASTDGFSAPMDFLPPGGHGRSRCNFTNLNANQVLPADTEGEMTQWVSAQIQSVFVPASL